MWPRDKPRFVPFVDIGGLRVRALAAFCHEWPTGQKYHHDPTKHSRAMHEYQLWLVEKGYVEFQNAGQHWQIAENEACLIPMKFDRDIATPAGAAWLSVRLEVTVFNGFSLFANFPFPVQWHPAGKELRQMKTWMRQIYHERHAKQDHRRLIADGLASALLGICWPYISEATVDSVIHSDLPRWLVQTLQHIAANPESTVAELAHEADLSPAQFRRAFRQSVGMSPREYVKRKRLNAARHLLAHTNLTLKVIAERIGLYDTRYFSQLFRENYGMSPTHFRLSIRTGEREEFLL